MENKHKIRARRGYEILFDGVAFLKRYLLKNGKNRKNT